MRKVLEICCLLISVICGEVEAKNIDEYAITVGMDKRIYILDLDAYDIYMKSNMIDELGLPTSIDFDSNKNRLYIGSENDYKSKTYYPLVILDVGGGRVSLSNKFKLDYDETESGHEIIYPIYDLRLSRNGKVLYLGYAHPRKKLGVSHIFNIERDELEELLDFAITSKHILSDDGKYAYEIWPSGQRKIKENGKFKIKKWSGGVATYDLEKNRKVAKEDEESLIKSGRGLNPLGMQIRYPLLQIQRGREEVIAFNRGNGKELWRLTLPGHTDQENLVVFDNNKKALLSIGAKIIIIDIKKGIIIEETNIGTMVTNIIIVKGKDIGIEEKK